MARPKKLRKNSLLESHKKVLFIYNPVAGRGKILKYLKVIEGIFARDGAEIELYPTKGKGKDLPYLIPRVHSDYDLIMFSGGDGTLNNVINILMKEKSRTLLGYIPLGSTCDFAHSVGISKKPFYAIKTVLFSDNVQQIDIGQLNDRYFAYVASFGALTKVTYITPQKLKKTFGYLAYVANAAAHLFPLPVSNLRIKTEKKSFEGEFIAGIISNSHYVGGFKVLNDKAKLNDGLLEILLIKKPKNIFGVISIAMALVGRRINKKHMISFQASQIEIEDKSGKGIDWNIDGEFGGNHTDANIRIADQQLRIITD